jgi:hypothetical protein
MRPNSASKRVTRHWQYVTEILRTLCVLRGQLKAMVPVGDKMPKPPRNAKELMATGLLTGHHVRCSCRGEQVCLLKDYL